MVGNFKNLTLTKRNHDVPVAQIVRGDRETSGIRLNINRFDAIDLSELGWAINIRNSIGDTDIQMFDPVIGDMWLTYEWTFPAIVAATSGNSVFSVEAVNSEGTSVWQSGTRLISVIERLDAEPGYDADEISIFQQTIADVGEKVRAMGEAVDGYEERINIAVTNAEEATVNANDAADRANEVAGQVAESIEGAVVATEAANIAATEASNAAVSATEAANAANTIAEEVTVKLENGEFNGYTPVKGIDYVDGTDYILTDNDRTDIAMIAADEISDRVDELIVTEGDVTQYTKLEIMNDDTEIELTTIEDLDKVSAKIVAHATNGDIHVTPQEKQKWNLVADNPIPDGVEEHINNSDIHVSLEEKENWNSKQDAINDIDSIRAGAAKGMTAIQEHQDLSQYALKTEIPNTDGFAMVSDIPDTSIFAKIVDIPDITGKQDIIEDLDSIRAGAESAITAIDTANEAVNVAMQIKEMADAGEFNGEQGLKGDPGNDYILSDSDKTEIASIASEGIKNVVDSFISTDGNITEDTKICIETNSQVVELATEEELSFIREDIQRILERLSALEN